MFILLDYTVLFFFVFVLPLYVRNDIRNLCENMIRPFLDNSAGKMGLVATFANILG